MALMVILLLVAPDPVSANRVISAASLETTHGRTRIEVESDQQLRFSLFVLRYPNRLVLELENAALGPALASLHGPVVAHPHLLSIEVSAPPTKAGIVQLVLRLEGEAEPDIRAFKPVAGRGHRLVLDIAPPAALAAPVSPAVAPAVSNAGSAPPATFVPSVASTSPAPTASVSLPAPARAASPSTAPAGPLPAAAPDTPAAAAPALAPAPPSSPASTPHRLPPSSAGPTAGPAPDTHVSMRSADDSNLVLLELRLDDRLLAETLTAYQYGRETFLPLGELSRLLTLAISTQPAQGTAEGFVLSEDRSFNLNLAQARLRLGDQTQVLDPRLLRRHSDDIYVESQLLSRWLPVDFQVDLSSLTLRVLPRERLPLMERWERERLAARSPAGQSDRDRGYPRQDLPYRLLGMPFIDQTLGLALETGDGGRQSSATYAAYLTSDLLGMESAVYVSSGSPNDSRREVRFTLGRHDPDAGLLGPLQARSVMFGSGVSMPGVANIAARTPTGKGFGLMLSNRPLSQPLSFDRHTLEGDLPPGWDVELFYNEALISFQASRADGRYRFENLPLAYGPNEFRLVFNGPLGQQRVERQNFLLEQSSTPPGALHYSLYQHQDSDGRPRSLAQVEYGLSKFFTGSAGFLHLPALAGSDASGPRVYSNLGLRAYWQSLIVSSELIRSAGGGWLNESGLKTRLGGVALSVSRTLLHDFHSEVFPAGGDPLRTRDRLRLDGVFPAAVLPRMPATLELLRDEFQSGRTDLTINGRLTAYVNRTIVSSQLSWQSLGREASGSGALQLSRRLGDLGLSGQLGYTLVPQRRVDSITISGDKRLGRGYLLNLGLARTMSNRETLLTAGLNKSLGKFGLGLFASHSSHGRSALGLQLFMSMGREPREAHWRFDALPKADSGSASVRVFLDSNVNGVLDADEETIEGVALIVNGSRSPNRTNAGGVAWLDRLPTRQHVDIGIDTQSLEDPFWAPLRKGMRLVPRPGHAAELDFAIILTGEIDGTIYLLEQTSKRGLGDVVVELLDLQRQTLTSTRSASDGFYIIPAVAPGRYLVRVAPAQWNRYGLDDPGSREVIVMPDGTFITGVDFVLERRSGS